MGTKTKEKLETEITLSTKDKSVTMTGEEFDRATGEILGRDPQQLTLFDGKQVNLIQNNIKGGDIVLFDKEGMFKKPLKFGDKVRLTLTAEVVKVTHGRNGQGALVRLQTLAVGFANFEGFEGGLV